MLRKAIPSSKATASYLVNLFFEYWIVPFRILIYLLEDNEPLFWVSFYQLVGKRLQILHLTTTTYRPETNAQAEHFNRAIFTHQRHYFAEHQRSWDMSVQHLAYACNTQAHRSTYKSPCGIVLRQQPCGPSILTASTVVPEGSQDSIWPQSSRANMQIQK